MSIVAGALEIQLLADIARLKDDMRQATRVVGGAMNEVERAAGMARTALGAIGLTVSAGALGAWAKSIIDAADGLSKLSQKTGIAVSSLSALEYAGRLSDVSTEALGKGVKGLSQKMLEANDATSKAGKIMTALGVDIRGGAMPAIERIADAFAALPDGPTKTAVAVELFGKAGMDMIPMLNQGSAGMRQMTEEAERLGIVLTEASAKAAEEFNDNLTRVKAAAQGASIAIFNDLSPSMLRVTKAMQEAARESGILTALWVAMGGVASEALGLNRTDAEMLAKNLRRAQEELATFREHIPKERQVELLAGVSQAGNMIEASFVKANFQLRLTQSTLDAIAGKFDDQVSRQQRQGQGVVGGTSSGLAESLRKVFENTSNAVDKTAKAMKDLGLADEHVVLWTRHLIAEAQRSNKEFDEQFDAVERLRLATEGTIKGVREYAENLEFQTKWLGLSNAEREREIALLHLERAGFDRNAKDIQDLANRILDAAQAQEEIRRQVSVWDQLGNAAGNFATALMDGPANALDYLRRLSKQWLAELISIFAKRWVLQLGAGLTGSAALAAQAGQVGQGTFMGSVAGLAGAGALLPGGAVGTAFGNIANMGASMLGASGSFATAIGSVASFLPVIGTVVAVASMLHSIFGDKGENPNFRWMQGTGGAGLFGGVSTSGNYDFEGSALLSYIGGLDARFASLLGPEGSAAASSRLAAYTGTGLRGDGQPAQFAFPEGDATAGEQLARELLQSRYGILFEGIDTGIAEQIRAWSGSSTDLQVFIDTMLTVAEGVGRLGVTGLDINSLRAIALAGETLSDTYKRVASTWSWFQENFTSEAVKLERAQEQLAQGFAAMGLTIPDGIDAFRELVESLDVTDPRWQGLLDLSPAFLMVTQAADSARSSTEDLASALQRQADIQRQIEDSVRSDRQNRLSAIIGARSGLTDFLDRTLLDTSLTTLDPFQRLDAARGEFESVLMAARGGDLGAAGRLGGAAETYLRIARELFASSPQYGDIFSAVTSGVSSVNDRLGIDQRQLEATLGIQAYMAESVEIQRETRDLISRIGQGAKSVELGAR